MKMKNTTKWLGCAIAAVGLTACDVDFREGEMPEVDVDAQAAKLPDYDIVKKEDGQLPKVDIDVKGGELPRLEVNPPKITAGLKEVEVKVPKVVMETKTVKVPVVGVDIPEENENEPNAVGEESKDNSENN